MASLKLNHLYKVYSNGKKAVNDFNIDIDDKEFIVFVGPSGCGKSTTLRMIAGLEQITAGELYIDNQLVNDLEPKDRDISFVFQNYALYPHWTVYQNMAFCLQNKKMPKEEINKRVLEAAKILDIAKYLDKKPKEMSGGERQRVALGRSLVRNPKVFLLDEPLSNLDAKLRAQMRTEITALHQKIGTTFIYVTHDQIEAMTMGTRIVVMKDGFIQQVDSPINLYNNPVNKFVAGFIGTPQMNFFSAKLFKNGDIVNVALENGLSFSIPYENLSKINYTFFNDNKEIIFGVRPEHISVSNEDTDLPCHINLIEQLGNESIVYGVLPNNNIDMKVTFKVASNSTLKNNDNIHIKFDKQYFNIFDKETELSLIKEIPEYFIIKSEYKNKKISLFGRDIALPDAIASKLSEGIVTIKIPSNSLIEGNDFELPILSINNVKNQNLVELKNDNFSIYFVSPTILNNQKSLQFSIKYEYLTFSQKDIEIVKPINNIVNFDGKILREGKRKETKYFFEVEKFKFPANLSIVAKAAAIDGIECHKIMYSFQYDMNILSTNKTIGIKCQVKHILDYGHNKYVQVLINEKEYILPFTSDAKVDDIFYINIENVSFKLINKENNIIIS